MFFSVKVESWLNYELENKYGDKLDQQQIMKPTWMLRLSTVADKDVHLSSKLEIPRTKFSHFERTVFKKKINIDSLTFTYFLIDWSLKEKVVTPIKLRHISYDLS